MSEPAEKQNKSVYKPRPVSGFPEWLPEYRAVELAWLDKLRAVFESYGFCNIETPSVEELDVLLAKGETDKEIYTLTRLQAEDGDDGEARLGLHFDLTVPFARYTAQHFNDLTFPFKRYQIQKSWRGERPQAGRFREFYQADIDVINVDGLPLHFDAEMPAILYEAYQALDIPPVVIKLNNRKILMGYLEGLGVQNISAATRVLDKLDKIGPDKVIKELTAAGLESATAEKALGLAKIKAEDSGFIGQIKTLNVDNPLLDEGLEELTFVMKNLSHLPKGAVVADLSIVRGFDYYTGTVVEAYLRDAPDFGAIGSGGRYDDLAGSYINKHLPGIGVSVGVSRLFSKLHADGALAAGPKSPAQVLVAVPSEERYTLAADTAKALRDRGFRVEQYHTAGKLKKQLAYAEKKGIPYVWFPPFEDGKSHEVKNMASGTQTAADPDTWTP